MSQFEDNMKNKFNNRLKSEYNDLSKELPNLVFIGLTYDKEVPNDTQRLIFYMMKYCLMHHTFKLSFNHKILSKYINQSWMETLEALHSLIRIHLGVVSIEDDKYIHNTQSNCVFASIPVFSFIKIREKSNSAVIRVNPTVLFLFHHCHLFRFTDNHNILRQFRDFKYAHFNSTIKRQFRIN